MKKILFTILAVVFTTINFAQMHGGGGHQDPADLKDVTVSGTVIVVEGTMNNIYYLDSDGDNSTDYHLNFGPSWYEPDSSDITRPVNGDQITVTGGLHTSYGMGEETIIVYELNGEFWRDPYLSTWNHMGRNRLQQGGMRGCGFGWDHDTLTTIELTGIALVDTTFYMNHYYLDVDNDTTPDYFLNFGPFWYEPESGVVRPTDGQSITVLGGSLTTSMEVPMLFVYELDGLVWRDSSSIGGHFGGGWFNADMQGDKRFHSPFDDNDHMTVREGWGGRGNGHGGGMNNFDSLFCQMLEIYPNNIPNSGNMNILAGYEIHMYDDRGNSRMNMGGMMGGWMEFNSEITYQLHYTDEQINYYNADENTLSAKYWDDRNNNWVNINGQLNPETNTIVFDSEVVSNYVVLTYASVTEVKLTEEIIPEKFALDQNYPNPFNPTTQINYQIPSNGFVILKVFDMLGKEIAELVNEKQTSGKYNVTFDASNLASGSYVYRITVQSYEGGSQFFSKTNKMMLIK